MFELLWNGTSEITAYGYKFQSNNPTCKLVIFQSTSLTHHPRFPVNMLFIHATFLQKCNSGSEKNGRQDHMVTAEIY